MTRIKMLTNTYDEYQGVLRRGDEKNVPQDTAERWEKNHIAEILEKDSSVEEIIEEKPMITFMAYEGEALEVLDKDPVEEEPEVKDEPDQIKKVDYSSLTRDELVAIANSRGITITKATKAETIIKKLEA